MNLKATLAATAALGLAAAGCGSDDDEKPGGGASKPTKMAIKLSGSGRQLEFTVPKSVKGGLVEMTFTNSTKKDASAQFVRAGKGHTAQEALQAGAAWGEKGKPLPEWAHVAGGFGQVKAGASNTATQQLPAGDYVVADLDSNTSAGFKVTGGGVSGSPSGQATITASEYKFEATGLQAGRKEVVFDNRGAEPHFVAAAEIRPGKTIADVQKFIRTEKGEPPINEQSGFSTAVLDGGLKQSVQFELKSGKYALLCFVPDRKGGPPHALKGMVSEATVR